MGNGQYQIPQQVRSDWSQHYRHGKRLLLNKITLQEFKMSSIAQNQEKDSISKLVERSIYTIPNTPKIIILNTQQAQLFILVQTPNSDLKHEIQKIRIFIDLLQLVKHISLVYQTLHRKYGPFTITQKMLGVCKNMYVMGWINQQQESCQVQYPLLSHDLSQKTMIENILQIVQRYTHFNLASLVIHKRNNFSAFISALSEYIYKRKFQTIKGQQVFQNRHITLVKSFSPQHKIKCQYNHRGASPKAQIQSQLKPKKRNDIPKFIKSIKDKKVNLLQSLNHRRTITKQYQEGFNKSTPKIIQPNQQESLPQLSKVNSLQFLIEEVKYKNSRNPSNAQTCEHLTSSRESLNRTIKRRQFFEKKDYKGFFEKEFDQHQASSKAIEIGISSSRSLHSTIKPKVNNLGLTASSKQFNQTIIESEEDSHVNKTIAEEISQYISNPPKSPRINFDYCQNGEVREEFTKIFNF